MKVTEGAEAQKCYGLLARHARTCTCLMTRLISINTGAAFDGVYVYASVIVPPWTSGATPLWVPWRAATCMQGLFTPASRHQWHAVSILTHVATTTTNVVTLEQAVPVQGATRPDYIRLPSD